MKAALKKPEFLAISPPLEIPSLKEIGREYYGDDRFLIEETDTHVKYLEWENDYDGCVYESDTPGINVKIVTYEKTMMKNPNYKWQMKAFKSAENNYNKAMATYEKRLAKYEKSQTNL